MKQLLYVRSGCMLSWYKGKTRGTFSCSKLASPGSSYCAYHILTCQKLSLCLVRHCTKDVDRDGLRLCPEHLEEYRSYKLGLRAWLGLRTNPHWERMKLDDMVMHPTFTKECTACEGTGEQVCGCKKVHPCSRGYLGCTPENAGRVVCLWCYGAGRILLKELPSQVCVENGVVLWESGVLVRSKTSLLWQSYLREKGTSIQDQRVTLRSM